MAERIEMGRIPVLGATRYDLLKAMPLVYPDQRWEGWKVVAYDVASRVLDETLPGEAFDPETVLNALAAREWVVARWDPHRHIRAWRGDSLPIARLDFLLTDSGRWRVRKWKAGWMASTDPASDELKPADWDPQTAWDWLKAHMPSDHLDPDGWPIERAGNFVRAWMGRKLPVRNGGQVIRMRDELTAYRNGLASAARGETWISAKRPAWWPESLGLSLKEVEDLDFAYFL